MKGKIGDSMKRVDAPEKTGGYASYIADMSFEGMLHAKTLRSTKPRARIKSIRVPDIPKGYFIVDKNDVPGLNRVKFIVDDQPFLADEEVNYIGEPILLVVGPEKVKIERILSEIRVDYEELVPVFTMEEAEQQGSEYCFTEYEIVKGNPIPAFERASDVFEDEYRTGYQEHIYLEPQGVIGEYGNGRVTVWGSMQCPYYVKNALIQGMGWEEDRIRVVQTTTGGAFGGKEDYPSIMAGHVAFAAVKTGKPVKLIFNRDEDILCTTKRHPSVIRIKTALDEHRQIIAMEIDIKLDGGAYEGLSSVVLQRAMFTSTGVYHIPNVRVKGKVLKTNTVPTGAFRGFGGPQSCFAIEMHMWSLAVHLSEDPLDFKLHYLIRKGDRTVTDGVMRHDVKLHDMIDLATGMSDFRTKYAAFNKGNDRVFKGIGMSLFNHGCAFTGSGEKDKIKAKVKLKKRADGSVEILVANVDMGQGPMTTLRKIIAQALDIPVEKVIYENPDTDRVPDSGPTVASRTVLIVGGLLEKAARQLRAEWDKAPEFEVLKQYEQPPYIEWDQETFKGDAYPVYSWGTNVVEVEVNPITYEIKVIEIWGVYDVGTPIDERIIQGQVEGGITQGLGYATIEVMNSKDGVLQQGSVTDYVIPTSMDSPKIHHCLIKSYFEYGPFGAKCAGELPFTGIAPALAAAVQNALKIPMRSIPVTPEYLLEAVEGAH